MCDGQERMTRDGKKDADDHSCRRGKPAGWVTNEVNLLHYPTCGWKERDDGLEKEVTLAAVLVGLAVDQGWMMWCTVEGHSSCRKQIHE